MVAVEPRKRKFHEVSLHAREMNVSLPFPANLRLNPTAVPAWKGKLSQHPTALLDDWVNREGDLAGCHWLHPPRAVQGRCSLLHKGVRHILAAGDS